MFDRTGTTDTPPWTRFNNSARPATTPSPGLGTHCEISGQFSAARADRFKLQRVARDWLKPTVNPKGKPWRTVNCSWATTTRDGVAVLQHAQTQRAHYGHLQRCGSVWTCPVCAARISEVRATEVASAMTLHTAADGIALMVTWTHSHTRDDELKQLIEGQRKAMSMMTSWRAYKDITARLGLVGTIRARELTYGDASGWHPHMHDVWLIRSKLSANQIEDLRLELFGLWLRACVKVGLPLPNAAHGVQVARAYSPAEYLAKWGRDSKWGTSRELTKATSKRGRRNRYTPFDLLRGVGTITPDRAQRLWREYAQAMHGARQLTWSRGLRSAMGIADISDEEIAEGGEELTSLLTLIKPDDWRRVLKFEGRATVLELAESGGAGAVRAYLSALVAGLRGAG